MTGDTKREKKMEHTMRLASKTFEKLRNSTKEIELILYDEKRGKVKVGDVIKFINLGDFADVLQTEVITIYRFSSFEELYGALPIKDLGYSVHEIEAASPDDMDKFYTTEEQAECGVVGIRLKLLPTVMI